MADYKNGAVFLVDFDPSVGHEYKKIRPAVIIQSNKTIKNSSLVTVMAITSQLTQARKEDVLLKKTTENGLYADSVIKVGCIHSFDRKRFLKEIGVAPQETMLKLSTYLKDHFDI
ncbi:MAG: type II toxin-antitoxin system PemK/MazF family toxin [Candidatus Gracilibacteria bacterium]